MHWPTPAATGCGGTSGCGHMPRGESIARTGVVAADAPRGSVRRRLSGSARPDAFSQPLPPTPTVASPKPCSPRPPDDAIWTMDVAMCRNSAAVEPHRGAEDGGRRGSTVLLLPQRQRRCYGAPGVQGGRCTNRSPDRWSAGTRCRYPRHTACGGSGRTQCRKATRTWLCGLHRPGTRASRRLLLFSPHLHPVHRARRSTQ